VTAALPLNDAGAAAPPVNAIVKLLPVVPDGVTYANAPPDTLDRLIQYLTY